MRRLLPVLLASMTLAACGGEDVTITQTTPDPAAEEEMSDDEIADLQAEIEELQEDVDESDEPAETTTTTEAPLPDEGAGVPASAEDCGAGVFVDGGTTSCGFGLNVAADYFSSPGNTFESFSPATGETYRMTCSGPPPILCTGGNNATVYITEA